MAKEKATQCKTKSCDNLVIDGKYCEYCTQKRKEKRNKAVGTGLAAGTIVTGYIINKGVLKKIPELVGVAVKLVLKR